jgi:phosphotransferase system IIA component
VRRRRSRRRRRGDMVDKSDKILRLSCQFLLQEKKKRAIPVVV